MYVTRSGSNQLHGSMFEFLRNGAMNARNFFAAQSDNLKRNQFGGTVGGPIIHNRLFWFASYQGTIVHNTSFTNTATVPSEALRRGDFNETGRNVTDPVTNQPFPNRTIPANRILPIATKLLAKVPTTTAANGLLRFARPDQYDTKQVLGKLDYNLGRHQLSGSVFYSRLSDPGWDGGGTLLTVRIGQLQTTQTFKMQDVYVIRPNLINTVVASGMLLDSTNIRTSTVWLSQFGPISFTEPAEADRELEIGVTGYGGWGSVTNSPPGKWVRRNTEINDTITWSSGRHVLNAGGEFYALHRFRFLDEVQPVGDSHVLRATHRQRNRRPAAGKGGNLHAERRQVQTDSRQGVLPFRRRYVPRQIRPGPNAGYTLGPLPAVSRHVGASSRISREREFAAVPQCAAGSHLSR